MPPKQQPKPTYTINPETGEPKPTYVPGGNAFLLALREHEDGPVESRTCSICKTDLELRVSMGRKIHENYGRRELWVSNVIV